MSNPVIFVAHAMRPITVSWDGLAPVCHPRSAGLRAGQGAIGSGACVAHERHRSCFGRRLAVAVHLKQLTPPQHVPHLAAEAMCASTLLPCRARLPVTESALCCLVPRRVPVSPSPSLSPPLPPRIVNHAHGMTACCVTQGGERRRRDSALGRGAFWPRCLRAKPRTLARCVSRELSEAYDIFDYTRESLSIFKCVAARKGVTKTQVPPPPQS